LDSAPDTHVEVTVAALGRDRPLSSRTFDAVLAKRTNCSLIFHDLEDDLFRELPTTRSITRSTYTRIILDRFVDRAHSRVLYLDADIIVGKDVSQLWNVDLGDRTLGAVQDHFRAAPQDIGFAEDERYFNAGVLLIDMQRWRDRKGERRVLDILERGDLTLDWMDQDALNLALRNDVHWLDIGWNWQPRCADVPAEFLGLSQERYVSLRNDPPLIHYTTSFKPWNAAYRVHYSDRFFAAARASNIPADLLVKRPVAQSLPERIMDLKTRLRWRSPRAFRAVRRLLRPTAARQMYRAGRED
jgi:lipopolysaccharide biosynthesis glycosyltransferase